MTAKASKINKPQHRAAVLMLNLKDLLQADPLVPNRVLRDFEILRKAWGGSGLESETCQGLNRRRFKEFEDAPLAAYSTAYLKASVK